MTSKRERKERNTNRNIQPIRERKNPDKKKPLPDNNKEGQNNSNQTSINHQNNVIATIANCY